MGVWNGKHVPKERLDAAFKKFESPAVQGKVREGFEQIERGEYVSISIDEIKQRQGAWILDSAHVAELILSDNAEESLGSVDI